MPIVMSATTPSNKTRVPVSPQSQPHLRKYQPAPKGEYPGDLCPSDEKGKALYRARIRWFGGLFV